MSPGFDGTTSSDVRSSDGSESSDSPRFWDVGLEQFIAGYVTHTDRRWIKELMFRVAARRATQTRSRILLLGFAFLVLGFWPTDFFLFEDLQVIWTFSMWRLFTFAAMSTIYFLLSRLNPVKERNLWCLIGLLALYFAGTGYLLGSVRGLSFPWFYIAYMIPMFSIVVSVDLVPRLVATATVTLAYVFPYLQQVQGAYSYADLHQFGVLTGMAVLLLTMIGHTVFHLDRVHFLQSRTLKKQRQMARWLSRHDQLTDLYSRHKFEDLLRTEFERARRNDSPLSLLMIDLDYFKRVNDRYGHPTGDGVLEEVGELLQETTRQVDVTGRYGGEEFTVLMPHTPLENARQSAHRIHREIRQHDFHTGEGETLTVTASIGIASLENDDEEPADLVRRADAAMYRAKKMGRNQVIRA